MGYIRWTLSAGIVLLTLVVAGCGSGLAVNNEASSSAIRAAEDAGASDIPSASLYLQLAKEEMETARDLAGKGHREEAQSMLSRAQADGELAIALSRGDADKKEAALAVDRVRQLRQDNQLSRDRK